MERERARTAYFMPDAGSRRVATFFSENLRRANGGAIYRCSDSVDITTVLLPIMFSLSRHLLNSQTTTTTTAKVAPLWVSQFAFGSPFNL